MDTTVNGRRPGGAASKRRQTNRKHSPLVLERLLAKQEADRAYIRPWLSQTAARLHAVGGWEGLDFACGPEEPAALVGEIPLDEVQGSAASVLDNVLDPSWCRLLVKRHMEVGFTPQADVDKLRKEAEREAVGRKGVAAALRDAYRLRRELGIQESFVESGKNTSEALTVKSWELADLLWQRCGPCIPPELREQGATALVPGTYQAQCIVPVFRFMRYSAGQGFRPHHDPTRLLRRHPRTQESGTYRTLVTIALYLNSGSEMDGGALSFLRAATGKNGRRGFESIASVEPAAGRAVIFPHNQLHEGGELAGGVKHMCQCDVLYRRVGD